MTTLFLITAGFPYGHSEPFLDYEIPFLAQAFDKVVIIPTSPDEKESKRMLPPNVAVVDYYKPKKFSVKLIFKSVINFTSASEFLILLRHTSIKSLWLNIKVMVKAYMGALVFSDWIDNVYNLESGRKIIYSYWLDEYALGLVELKKKNGAGDIKILSRAHGWDVYYERHPGNYLPFRKKLLFELDVVFFVSQHGKRYTLGKIGFPELTTAKVSYLGTRNQEMLSPEREGLRLFSCSRVIPLKRLHIIIESLALIDNHDVHWHHAGGGPLLKEMEALALHKLGSMPNIQYFFHGEVPSNSLPALYRENRFHLFINVSEFEGLPVSIMEAMSFGVPVVATNVGGVSEIVNESNGYLLSSSTNPAEIAATIARYINLDEDEKKSLSENAWKTWHEYFNAEINFKAFTKELLLL